MVSCGQILVALVFAEMAGRIPLTGSVYNWNSRLASPAIAWITGWLAVCNYALAVPAVTRTMLPLLNDLSGGGFGGYTGALVVSGLIVLQLLINLYGVRLTSHMNVLAVVAEIVSIAVLTVLVAVAIWSTGQFHPELLTAVPPDPRPYWPAFLMASLLGAWCLIGFESAGDVSEETLDARRAAPRGIVLSLLASSTAGFIFIVVMTLAIPDVEEIKNAANPLLAIAAHHLGNGAAAVFKVFALIAMFSCSMICMTAASRGVFAMARDGRFAAAPVFRKISQHRVPNRPLFLIAAAGIGLAFMGSLETLYGAEAVCTAIYYLITVVAFAWKGKTLGRTDTFSLGRWHWPGAVAASAWLIVEIGILTIPAEFHAVAAATGAILAVGVVLYFISGRKPEIV